MLAVFIYEGVFTNHSEIYSMRKTYNYLKHSRNLGIPQEDRETLKLRIAIDVLRDILDALEREVPTSELVRIYEEAKERHPDIVK